MTKNEIIETLFFSKDFNDCINMLVPPYLQEDLKAEVCLVICEKDEAFVIGLHERQQLKFYIVRIIVNMIMSNTSTFYRKYRQPKTIYTDIIHCDDAVDEIEYIDREEQFEKMELSISKLGWYEKELLNLYIEQGNYRAVSNLTKIPFQSIWKTLSIVYKKIKKDINE